MAKKKKDRWRLFIGRFETTWTGRIDSDGIDEPYT